MPQASNDEKTQVHIEAEALGSNRGTSYTVAGALIGALLGLPVSQMFQGSGTWLSIYPTIDYVTTIFEEANGMIENGLMTPVFFTVIVLAAAGGFAGNWLAKNTFVKR